MADVVARGNMRPSGMYFPAIPPPAPKAATSYPRAISEAPYTALMGVVVDGRQPTNHAVTPRCRMRSQVGSTNRWRLPQSLGSDLLGTAQAIKAISFSYNQSLRDIITAENPKNTVNLDVDQPYSFRLSDDRPKTTPTGAGPLTPQFSRLLGSNPPPSTAPAKYAVVRPLTKVMPTTARLSRPMDIFHYHSKRSHTMSGPDVLLQCLGLNWELHRPYLQKAEALAELLAIADEPAPKKYYYNEAEALNNFVSKNKYYNSEYKEGNECEAQNVDTMTGQGIDHPKHVSQQRVSNKTVISLDITDPRVTKQALAVALGNLYHEEVEVETVDAVGVLAAAYALKFKHLEDGCTQIMMHSISSCTVCSYHQAAVKYKQERLKASCERWLELNLVPELVSQIHLRQLPMSLLLQVLTSSRVFTYNEFSLYRVLAYWVFLQMNPTMQLMPSYSTVLTYFNSLPKSTSLIDREEGQHFAQLFMALRLHGVTDTSHMQDIQTMNILPQTWVMKILTQHYHSLQGGGDMSLMTDFNTGSVRQGFIIKEEPHYHSEILSLHGFHFELKANKQAKKGSYSFYMQRLKPGDPILSFRQCERHTFSMRPDREVRYAIRVQHFDKKADCQMYTTGILTQSFGLGTKTSKSEVITLDNLVPPIHVTFAILFPPS